MQISDLNGIESIDMITVNLGQDEATKDAMTWEPRNGMMCSPQNSQVELHDVNISETDGIFTVH